mmetsp:Transcript_24511/g.77470  ORF Transcript_24511/g.77470 Transcript_24511/m.77470 type:complete len:318 (+) Transcript_24511:1938-2891(+)
MPISSSSPPASLRTKPGKSRFIIAPAQLSCGTSSLSAATTTSTSQPCAPSAPGGTPTPCEAQKLSCAPESSSPTRVRAIVPTSSATDFSSSGGPSPSSSLKWSLLDVQAYPNSSIIPATLPAPESLPMRLSILASLEPPLALRSVPWRTAGAKSTCSLAASCCRTLKALRRAAICFENCSSSDLRNRKSLCTTLSESVLLAPWSSPTLALRNLTPSERHSASCDSTTARPRPICCARESLSALAKSPRNPSRASAEARVWQRTLGKPGCGRSLSTTPAKSGSLSWSLWFPSGDAKSNRSTRLRRRMSCPSGYRSATC